MATLLTFRLDRTMRERVRARLKRDGTTLSAVVTRGLHEYVRSARTPDSSPLAALPEHVAARLRDLRSAGRSEALSGTLAELHQRGWPLPQLWDTHTHNVKLNGPLSSVRNQASGDCLVPVAFVIDAD